MKYVLYSCGEQPINKHFLQMERHLYDKDVIGCVQRNVVFWCEKGYGQWFWSLQDIRLLNKDGEKLLDHQKALSSIEETKKAVKTYWSEAENLLESLNLGVAQKELAVDYEKYSAALRRVYAHFNTTVAHTTHAVETRLKSILFEKFPDNAEDYFVSLTTPEEPGLLLEELREWAQVLKNPSGEAILAHARKYPINLANVFSNSAAVRWGGERIESNSLEQVENRISEAEEGKREVKLAQKEILEKLGSEQAEELSWFLRQGAIGRLLVKNCWNGEAFHLLPFFKKISLLGGCSVRDAYAFHTWREVCGLLHNNRALSEEELARRREYCLLYFSGERIALYSGEKALLKKKRALDSSLPPQDTKVIYGAIANKGIVSGKAIIIRADNPDEISKTAKSLKGDYILVAGMTNPTMVPLFSKVKGIVTDEGGSTCHAAVLSREFKLPCLVGCKVATLVLKEGEEIILDANAGFVRRSLHAESQQAQKKK